MKVFLLSSVSICFLSLLMGVNAYRTEFEADELKSLLPNYDKNVLPPSTNRSATMVELNIFVRQIEEVNSKKQEFTAQLTVRMQFTDSRLIHSNRSIKDYIQLEDDSLIWLPDLFFSNEKDSKKFNLIKPNVLLRIYPDGRVLYSVRLMVRLSCPMYLGNFPFDSQECRIKIGSYGHTTDNLVILWKKENTVQVSSTLNFPHFRLINYSINYCTSRTNTGTYSCVFVSFVFKRNSLRYYLTIFYPSIILVIIAWLSFFIDAKDQMLLKCALNLFSLFSQIILSLLSIYFDAESTSYSYMKAIDLWFLFCMVFITVALIESIIVYRRQIGNTTATLETTTDNPDEKTTTASSNYTKFTSKFGSLFAELKSDLIDCLFRVLFIISFTMFAIIYFSVYDAI